MRSRNNLPDYAEVVVFLLLCTRQVDANDDVALQEDEETDEKPPLPVAGFGSARYGMLGGFDKSLAQADPEDLCEISCPSWRFVACAESLSHT